MLRTALLALVLGIGTPYLGGFADLFTSACAGDAVESGCGWDPLGGSDGLRPAETSIHDDRGSGWDPNGATASSSAEPSGATTDAKSNWDTNG
jgi:hypothetical protein